MKYSICRNSSAMQKKKRQAVCGLMAELLPFAGEFSLERLHNTRVFIYNRKSIGIFIG